MLDFRLKTFLDLCQSKSYTHTAQNLNITQPVQNIDGVQDVTLVEYRGNLEA